MNKWIVLLLTVVACSQGSVSETPGYHRKAWKHWIDHDRDCQNTRQEILQERSIVKVKWNKKGCSVLSGKWEDYYYPEVHKEANKVDIDHIVPLKHAHVSGGAKWSRQQKQAFANDPLNLAITNRAYNRKKGAKGIDQWLPVNREYACKYIRDWIKIKEKYALQISLVEKQTIQKSACR